jgi:hypothetical protein
MNYKGFWLFVKAGINPHKSKRPGVSAGAFVVFIMTYYL